MQRGIFSFFLFLAKSLDLLNYVTCLFVNVQTLVKIIANTNKNDLRYKFK